ncbi:hypothetical protein ACEPAI_6568 [Sanghuangporus weigelae]
MSPRGHVVALTIAAWGHAKATCTLLTKIVRFRNVHATLFTPLFLYDQTRKEISNNFVPGSEDDLKELIRVVGIESSTLPIDFTQLTSNFLDGYRKLCTSQTVQTTPTSDDYHSAIPPPQLVIMDFFAYDAFQGVRQETGRAVPIFALESTSASAVLFLWGPENLGGNGDLSKKLEVITEKEEKAVMAEADKIYRRVKGELLTIPGLPPMYDHEFSPQEPFMDFPIAFVNARAHRFFVECDGMIMNTTPILEKEAIAAIKEWLVDKPIICPAPFDYPVIPTKNDKPAVTDEVHDFLNAALHKHGPHSVVYMSFGSTWWTKHPEKIWAALDVLIESGIPFMFSRASPFATVPDEIETKIKESGLGYISKWLPQTSIFKHEACGWFVTHCGHNSFTEAITAGVPMICWPFDIDHPVNAALISDVLKVGYELFETRSWHGLRPIHRLGNKCPEGTLDAFKREFKEVLSKATGEDGKLKRANAQKLRDKVARSWEADGEAWSEIKRIDDVLH